MTRALMRTTTVGAVYLALHGSALAGGLEWGGYNIDLLFDPSKVVFDSSATFVAPQRKLKNVQDVNPRNGLGSDGIGGGKTSAEGAESFWIPRVGIKASIGDSVDCMVDYSHPWGAHTAPGKNWVGANYDIETKIESEAYAATCSYRVDLGPGAIRLIGGVVYQEVGGFKESLVAPAGLPGVTGTGVGRLDLDGTGWGWRAGASYEIPEYAMRFSLVYNSEVNLDDLAGTLNLQQVNGMTYDIYAAQAMPQSLELKAQTGIAPDWLVFGSVKWVDWSEVQQVPIYIKGTRTAISSLDLGYRDGYTISGGLGHRFNEQWDGAVFVAWDRGTSQGFGSQSDSWTLGVGVGYSPTKNIEFRLAGALSLLTAGESRTTTLNGVTYGSDVNYDYGTDLAAAISTSMKVKF